MKDFRRTREYRVWRVQVVRRDKVCQVCGSRQHREAHHMNSASYFPDERYDVDNGVVLCKKCHSQFHNNYKKSFRTKCTKDDYSNFIQLVEYVKGISK